MSPIIYRIHRAINHPIDFKGLKGQYVIFAAIAIVGDLLLFVALYVAGLNSYLDIIIALGLGGVAISTAFRFSKKYGEYGLMKKAARKKVPEQIRCSSRSHFFYYKNFSHGKKL